MDKFCSRPSRLFSGEVAALFGQDAQQYSYSTILDAALSSPFSFFMDSEIAQYSQFWNITRLQLQIFAKANGLNNWILSHVDRFYLCPNSMVGSAPSGADGAVSGLLPQNFGVPLEKLTRQQQENTLAFLVADPSPIIVPPGWFLRYQMFDNGGGPNFLPAGTKITVTMLRQIIPANFAEWD